MNGSNIQLPTVNRIVTNYVVSFATAILFCTYLRISFLLFYPFIVVLFFYLYRLKLDRNATYLLGIVFICWLISLRHGLFLKYNLVSLYFFVPFIVLLFAVPQPLRAGRDLLTPLMVALSAVMVVNNIFGILQYIEHPFDDSFEGLYGTFTVSQNGLSIINSLLFFYHITRYQHSLKPAYLFFALFFIVCGIMGFYGAGLVAFAGAFLLTFFKFRLRNVVALTVSMLLVLGIAYLVMRVVSPLVLDYNVNIIKKFLDPAAPGAPRKIIIFRNYLDGYGSNIIDLLFGSGPGTFNSRSAFVVGSPAYFQVEPIKSDVQPEYFRNYAYTLWNPSNTGPYDGFMNQPFTSLLALLGEYGVLVVLCLLYVAVARFRIVLKQGRTIASRLGMSTEFKLFRFCFMFLLILLVIDNYMEYPEIIALLILVAKLAQQQMKTALVN
jgi:hypothetical protein